MKVLFVEPPKDYWFLMGEYLPPPLSILVLAAYLEAQENSVEIDVLDCQAERMGWKDLERYIECSNPDIIAPSGVATCNTYSVLRSLEIAKKVNPDVTTIVGGQHFTATAQESLEIYPEIDIIIRGEGEKTLTEVVRAEEEKKPLSSVRGISFRHEGKTVHNPPMPLLENLDELPFPGYHFVEGNMKKYHFTMMAGAKIRYALIEGSRGCLHRCTFCSQWSHWGGTWRSKNARRVADEMEYCFREYGSRFLWLADDNLGLGRRTNEICNEIVKRGIADEIMWFAQVRSDDITNNKEVLPAMRKSGCLWVLTGLESHNPRTLEIYNKKIKPSDAKEAIDLLKENDIFSQATLIIGERKDTHESIEELRKFANEVDPGIAIFMILTPFPGTELYESANRNGWIEDTNWAHYDMVHAIMPTESLSRRELQEELYQCYRSFYGSLNRRLGGIFSTNRLRRRTYGYLASQGLLKAFRDLF